MTDETPQSHLLAAIKLGCDERIVKIPAPMMMTASLDGKFKQIKLQGGEEYLLSDVREGKREPFILIFKPFDDDTKGHLEIEVSKLTGNFPELDAHFTEILAGYLVARQREAEVDELDAPFIASNVSAKRAVGTFLRAMPDVVTHLTQLRAERAARAQIDAYADNDEWGTW